MATVVIIHAADDALPARALAEKLRLAKLNVVLEKQPGEDVRNALKSAQVTIALWSPRSVAQQALIDDVSFARGKSKVLHACMQNSSAPEAFRGDKSVNLTGWRGEDEFPPWRDLAKLVTERAGVAPLPPPAPRPASGFFQPGRVDAVAEAAPAGGQGRRAASAPQQRAPQPAQRQAPRQAQQPQRAASPPPRAAAQRDYAPPEPEKKGGGGMMIGIIVLVVVLALGGGGYYFWQQSQGASTAQTAWAQIDRNDPAALRAFITAQSGPLKTQAESALGVLEERSFEAAMDSGAADDLQRFLHDFPDSSHVLAVRGKLAQLQVSAGDQPPAATTVAQPPDDGATTTGATTTAPSDAPAQLGPPGQATTTAQAPPSAPSSTP